MKVYWYTTLVATHHKPPTTILCSSLPSPWFAPLLPPPLFAPPLLAVTPVIVYHLSMAFVSTQLSQNLASNSLIGALTFHGLLNTQYLALNIQKHHFWIAWRLFKSNISLVFFISDAILSLHLHLANSLSIAFLAVSRSSLSSVISDVRVARKEDSAQWHDTQGEPIWLPSCGFLQSLLLSVW